MESGREVVCLIFAVVPAICLSIDTRSISNLKINFHTDNYSNHILGHHSELYFRDKYFDLLSRAVKSYRTAYVPLDTMRRSLRSFTPSLGSLTSIKREKEQYENLQDLQYYGTEIPKKFTVKRLFSPKYFSLWNTDFSINDEPSIQEVYKYSDKSVQKRAVESETSQHSKSIYFDKNDQPIVSNSPMTFNVPKIVDDIQPSESSNLNIETIPISNISESLDNIVQSIDEKHHVKSKRVDRTTTNRFAPDVCNMDDLEIDIRFHEMMDTEVGLFRLTCTGTIIVNKCEGACNSHVNPSVNNYDGFERQCSCCKDSATTSRTVTLSMCTLGPEEVHGYSISRTIVEPTACSCQECRN